MKPSRLLLPLVPLYGAGVALRNTMYDHRLLRSERVPVPVISVGNITAGGTGKTPFIEYLLRLLDGHGKHVAVLSRGYGRDGNNPVVLPADPSGQTIPRGTARELGDELRQVAMKFPQAAIIADAERTRGAKVAVERLSADVLLLDDGFQHRALARDLDIVLVDSTRPLGTQPMLPAGYRREPMAALKRAGLIAYTRADGKRHPEMASLMKQYPGIEVCFTPVRWRSLDGQKGFALDTLAGKPAVAFCGIGNPDAFMASVAALGIDVRAREIFPDHHWYTDADIARLAQFKDMNYVTTEKDAARLAGLNLNGLQPDTIFALEIHAEVVKGEAMLHEKIEAAMKRN